MDRLSTRFDWRGWLPGLLVIIGTPLILYLVYGPPYLNYDASYSLVWAQDIANGITPDYEGFIAPTPHPLQTFVSFLALPLGIGATTALAWMVMLTFGGIVWLVYLLGRDMFNPWVGALAAVVVLTRPAFDRNALATYQDIPFVMFVIWALLLEVRQPRRGWPVLVLLALAGLLRPEAWVLAGLYWLFLFPSRTLEGARVARGADCGRTGPVGDQRLGRDRRLPAFVARNIGLGGATESTARARSSRRCGRCDSSASRCASR